MFRKNRIRKHEVGLWFRHGDFERVLEPGVYWLPIGPIGGGRLERYSTLDTQFVHPMLDVLVADEELREQLTIVDLTDQERALVWKQGRLGWTLGPGLQIHLPTYDCGIFDILTYYACEPIQTVT